MSRLFRWMLAGTTWPALIACTASNPQVPPQLPRPLEASQTQALLARDFYFPASGTMRAVYSFNESAQLPSPLESYQATGSMTVEVLRYSPTSAEFRTTTIATGEDGQPTTETSTSSVSVEPDGTVVAGDGATLRHSNAVFTAEGAIVAPASGSEIPALRARLVGSETLTVPAGTFETVHLQEGPDDANAPRTNLWLARGVGIVRQQMEATFSVRTSETQTGQGSSRFELRLESFTP